ncbi:nucleotidyltransferase family protein [Phycicoccus sp.]|uniref:nucleotidyltransferase family protein n=1 Tax=Phycicoccus sp. TaxID=1902410 RepID=UPI002CB4B6B0|nr:nucleotidyltransferase family protein [Phycicoccus sp.]HMM97071.1 nucleotidyltransferase family protein [Phycicoccus sp.]
MPTVGLLLAAGAGRRMGGPKALVRPGDDAPTLLETALARLHAAGLARVVVVLGASAEAARPPAEAAGAEVVVADDWATGMGASLRAGLGHLAHTTDDDAALVTLVDLLDVDERVHRRVLGAAQGPTTLVRAAYDGTPGHPVLLGRDHWAGAAGTAHGDRGARDYLRSHAPVLVECGDLATGRDADTPDALGAGPGAQPG